MPRNDDVYSKTFVAVLYPDDESQSYAIEQLKKNAYDNAGILHDHCTDETGQPKKNHYHFVIRFKSQKGLSTLAKELKVNSNYLEPSSSLKQALLYLIHRGWPEKYQYDISAVFGSLKKTLLAYLDETTESERILEILELLDAVNGPITVREFIQLCAKEELYSDLRRSGYLFATVIKEHNARYL